MTYTPTIFDWRPTVQPLHQVFTAGGQALDGGMTVGGAAVESPEPGGRGELRMEFVPFANADTNVDASWTASRLLNGSVFRLRMAYPTPQFIPDSDLGGNTGLGVNWSNNLGWAGNAPWAFDPSGPVTTAGVKGGETFTVNMNLNGYGRVLKLGHVIGFHIDGYDFAHKVMDISYNINNRATVYVNPPLRRAVPVGQAVKFRPTMLATCVNAREVVGNYLNGTTMTFNPARFIEALV